MTMYEPNPDVRPMGDEGAEFVDPGDRPDDEGDDDEVDPSARPTGSPPVAP